MTQIWQFIDDIWEQNAVLYTIVQKIEPVGCFLSSTLLILLFIVLMIILLEYLLKCHQQNISEIGCNVILPIKVNYFATLKIK